MPSPDTLLAFLGVSILITLAPGPDNLMVIGRSLARGRRAGLAFGLGCAAGCLTHIAWATLGVAALIRASAGLFTAFKLAGAAWLVWLGIQALRSGGALSPAAGTPPRPWQRDVARGFVANALNPKVALFFLAFVPQFIEPGASNKALTFLFLGAIFNFNGTLWCLFLAWATARIGALGVGSQAGAWISRSIGVFFVYLGVRQALAEQG